ncbi:hypothetical protein F4859DRAFT_492379 [Xylaria cf. heliscus]|nr:hypothetical protein F4859DRAFT_492379 [Xylaria cf. heliscus]
MNVEIPGISTWSPEEQQARLDAPALNIPAGVESKFGDPRHVDAGILFFSTAVIAVSTFFVATRIYVRLHLVKSMSIPDYLTIIAYGLLIGFVYCYYKLAIGTGFYVHQWDISLREYSRFLYYYHLGVNLYIVIVPLVKAAILLDWIKIFVPAGTRPAFFWVCYVVMGINTAFYIASLALANAVCRPLQHFWDPLVEGHCGNGRIADVISAVFNSAADIIILILPQTIIWKLHMAPEKKFGIAAIFAIGLIAVVASIVRLVSVVEYLDAEDSTYGLSAFLLWTLAETWCIFLVLCVPSAPKALHNPRLLQYATSTLRSLGALLSTARRGSSSSVRDPWPPLPESNDPSLYHKPSADEIPLKIVDSKGRSPAPSAKGSRRRDQII